MQFTHNTLIALKLVVRWYPSVVLETHSLYFYFHIKKEYIVNYTIIGNNFILLKIKFKIKNDIKIHRNKLL